MKTTLESVLEFHEAFECPVAAEPRLSPSPNADLLLAIAAKLHMFRNQLRERSKDDPHCLRASLEIEELGEELTAMATGDLKGLLDAYIDKEYIDKGSILTFGLQNVYPEGFERVHQSNLSKLVDGKPVKDEAGKVKKPPTYQPVVLDDLVDGTWLASNPVKPKTRFEKLVDTLPELTVSVMASSKYPPDDLDTGDFDLQASSNLDELLESPTFKPIELTDLEQRYFDSVNRKDKDNE